MPSPTSAGPWSTTTTASRSLTPSTTSCPRASAGPPAGVRDDHLEIRRFDQELIFDVSEPIQNSHAGAVHLGTSDAAVAAEMEGLSRSVLWALALCLLLGQGLALLLAQVLTSPIRHLTHATDRLRRGEFDHCAEVLWSDEIGQLTVAFNQMAGALEGYQREVDLKEQARQSLLKRLVQAQEDERRSIALELHDQLGQSLLAVLLNVHGLARSGDLAPERAPELEAQIRWLTDEVRGIARRMRPSLLDDGGLEVALSSYVEETAERADMLIDYQCIRTEDDGRLPSEVEVTLYRIAQESLTNVLRHSAASQASVVLARNNGEATLLIEDDGVGFDLGGLDDRRGCEGLGLVGMRERTTLMGGQLSIQTTPGSGTTVRVKIPTPSGRQPRSEF